MEPSCPASRVPTRCMASSPSVHMAVFSWATCSVYMGQVGKAGFPLGQIFFSREATFYYEN